MPSMCCAPDCTSNKKGTPFVHFFLFPKFPEWKAKWMWAITRNDLDVSRSTNLCYLHFEDEDIMKTSQSDENGGLQNKWELRPGAIPSKFPKNVVIPQIYSAKRKKDKNIKTYDTEEKKGYRLTETKSHSENDPAEHAKLLKESLQQKITILGDMDCRSDVPEPGEIITSGAQISKRKYNLHSFNYKFLDRGLLYYKMNFDENPKISRSFLIKSNLDVDEICVENCEVDNEKFEHILGNDLKCDNFEKLENLLFTILSYEPKKRGMAFY